jgi:DNA-binding response OmpR family regulator
MIGLISQNTTVLTALCDLLTDIPMEPWQPNMVYDAVLLVSPIREIPELTTPVIALGIDFPGADLVLPTPISPNDLQNRINAFLSRQAHLPSFENEIFRFDGRLRLLIDKSEDRQIPLTEKENAILCCLVTAAPETVSRAQLLTDVWHYRPDIETHTVETHIYALRQKIGPKADSLIQNDTTGYFLAG